MKFFKKKVCYLESCNSSTTCPPSLLRRKKQQPPEKNFTAARNSSTHTRRTGRLQHPTSRGGSIYTRERVAPHPMEQRCKGEKGWTETVRSRAYHTRTCLASSILQKGFWSALFGFLYIPIAMRVRAASPVCFLRDFMQRYIHVSWSVNPFDRVSSYII